MDNKCWVCRSDNLKLLINSSIDAMIGADAFKITDRNYGTTRTIYECKKCGLKDWDRHAEEKLKKSGLM